MRPQNIALAPKDSCHSTYWHRVDFTTMWSLYLWFSMSWQWWVEPRRRCALRGVTSARRVGATSHKTKYGTRRFSGGKQELPLEPQPPHRQHRRLQCRRARHTILASRPIPFVSTILPPMSSPRQSFTCSHTPTVTISMVCQPSRSGRSYIVLKMRSGCS